MPRTYQGGTGGERVPRIGIEHHHELRILYQVLSLAIIGIAGASFTISPEIAIAIDALAIPFVFLASREQRKIKSLQQTERQREASLPR